MLQDYKFLLVQTLPIIYSKIGLEVHPALQLVLPLQEREDEIYLDSPPSDEDNYLTPTLPLLKFNCELCQHESTSIAALNGHISVEHNPTIPHTSHWGKKQMSHMQQYLPPTF